MRTGACGSLTRRRLLAGAAAVAGAGLAARTTWAAAAPGSLGATGTAGAVDLAGVPVLPRSTWAAGLPPRGPLSAEPEVRYLLVHHSVDPGDGYGPDAVEGVLRAFYRAHTGKGWPDLAYNFLVDRFGRVWEGRAGSLDGPVAGDATGGNQGWDQLCCFIGDHQRFPPTPGAFAAMAALLGALAGRYGIPIGEGATTTFVSRGSNLHPAGAEVTTPTVAGHRDMSRTACPGDLVVARLPELRALAAGRAAAPAGRPPPTTTGPPTTTSTTAPTTTTAPATTSSPPAPTPTAGGNGSPSTTAAAPAGGSTPVAAAPDRGRGAGPGVDPAAAAVGAGALAAAVAAVAAARRARVARGGQVSPGDEGHPGRTE